MPNTDRNGVAIAIGDWCEIYGLDGKGKDTLLVIAMTLKLLDDNECMYFCGYHPINIPGHNLIRLDDTEQFKRSLKNGSTYSPFDLTPTIDNLLGTKR